MIGEFCHSCGQQSTGRKTSLKDMFGALLSGFLSLERSVFGTVWQIFLNPKKVIRNYWDGYRNYYHRPGSLIFYVIFIFGLHLNFIDNEILGLKVSLTGVSDKVAVVFSPQVFFLTLILPLLTLSTYLAHWKQRRSIPEHFISATYIFAAGAIIFTIVSDILYLSFGLGSSTLLFLGLLFLWSARTHSSKTKWYHILLNSLLEVLTFLLIVIIFLGLLYMISPDSFKLNQTTTS